MPNILIRDLSQAAIDRIDDAAADLGLSRNEYLRRKFEQTTSEPGNRTVTAEDWKRSAETFALGYSARTGELGRREFASPPLALMPLEYLTPGIEDRAIEVQMLLADHGQHRAPSIPDLLVAATAEKAGLTVLAVDKDFNLIAQITGQPVEELAQ